MRVEWLKRASNNLVEIHDYVALDSAQAASIVVSRIVQSGDRLAHFPLLGRAGRIEETRELVTPGLPYLLIYRIRDEVIQVIRVLHTSRKRSMQF